jgi:hypothetical protein
MRWLYTAITRATQELYLVNFNDKFFWQNRILPTDFPPAIVHPKKWVYKKISFHKYSVTLCRNLKNVQTQNI